MRAREVSKPVQNKPGDQIEPDVDEPQEQSEHSTKDPQSHPGDADGEDKG